MSCVIVVVGMPGSGKDVFVRTAAGMGFGHVSMGDVVRRFASEAGLPPGDASIGGFADSERKLHGPAIWAERTIDALPQGDAVIDGSRSMHEISAFRERLGHGLAIVSVEASADTRFGRLRLRGRSDDPLTREDFERRDARELSWGLGDAMGSADIRISNEAGLDEFEAGCRRVIGEIQASHGKSI